MKRIITLLIAATALLSVQCTKQDPFEVSVGQESIKLKAGAPVSVPYTVANNAGNVTVSLSPAIEGISVENSFSGTAGTITFTTTLTESLDKEARIVFNDSKEIVEKPLKIHVSSSWNIDPSGPVQQ